MSYCHCVGDERRSLGIRWAHRDLHNAKSGWEASSWLVFIAGLWSLSLQIMNIHQVRLVKSCEMFACRSDSVLLKTWPCPRQIKLCPCPDASSTFSFCCPLQSPRGLEPSSAWYHYFRRTAPSFGYLFPVFPRLDDFFKVYWWPRTRKVSTRGGTGTRGFFSPLFDHLEPAYC